VPGALKTDEAYRGATSSEAPQSTAPAKPSSKTPSTGLSDRPLILIAFSETAIARANLKFFIAHGLHDAADLYKKYTRFITLNTSLRGPFMPHWADNCWSDMYLSKLTDQVKVCIYSYPL
jgi:hypothetical protein